MGGEISKVFSTVKVKVKVKTQLKRTESFVQCTDKVR